MPHALDGPDGPSCCCASACELPSSEFEQEPAASRLPELRNGTCTHSHFDWTRFPRLQGQHDGV